MEKEKNNVLILQPLHSSENESEANTATDHGTPESPVAKGENNEEKSFRCKLCIHAILCFSMFNVGWSVSMRGPVFPDLMEIVGVSSGAASVFVSANYVGFLIGSIFCGFVIDRFNKHLVMACAALCFGCTSFVIPLCSILWTMVIVNAVQGFGNGLLLTGCFTTVGQLWGAGASARSFMQSFQLCMPVGAIVSPLLVAPFLSSDHSVGMSSNMTQPPTANEILVSNSTLNYTSSSVSVSSDREYRLVISDPHSNQTNGRDSLPNDQQLIIPFSVSGAMVLLVMLLNLIAFCQYPRLETIRTKTKEIQSNNVEQKQSLSLSVRIVRLYLIGQLGFFNKGIENAFIQFFPAFLHSKMGWTKLLSSDIMSLYWGPYAFGRVIGIFISLYIKSSTHLFFEIPFLILSIIVLLVGTNLKMDSVMWVSAVIIGLALSTVSPCLISMGHNEILSRSGKHNSFLLVACSLGSIVLPLIVGNLVELDYIWYVYVLLTSSILMLLNHICLHVFARMKLKPIIDVREIIIDDNDTEITKMAE